MTTISCILVVDDDRYDNDRYCQVLRSAGYDVLGITDLAEAMEIVQHKRFDVVLLDMLLPLRRHGKLEFGGLELLRHIKAIELHTQVIAVTGYGSRELATEAMLYGAFDYVTKDLDTEERLPGSVRVAAARAHVLRIATANYSDLDELPNFTVPTNLIADSTAMRQALRRAQSLALIDAPLLINGEPGVGKELLASIIHLNSSYANGPFIVAASRGLSTSLVELWGEQARPGSGYCTQAEHGTLVLKNIHEIPYQRQKLIAEFLHTRTFQRIGAANPTSCHLRIIATTTADLDRLVRQGRFWRGLYDLLSVAALDVPPLRERRDKDDITAIAGYLLRRYGLAEGLSAPAAETIAAHDYRRANVKELEDILREAAEQAGGGIIEQHHLPAALHVVAQTESISVEPNLPVADEVTLTIRVIPSTPTMLIWESHNGSTTRSTIHVPFEADSPLVLRALDAIQWPDHPQHGPQFTLAEQARLIHYGLWQNDRVIPEIGNLVGRRLYQAITADASARSALEQARNLAVDRRQPLTFIWRFSSDTIAMAALPWELLRDERQALLLGQPRNSSLVRYIDLPQSIPPTPVTNRAIRLLAVCPTNGMDPETRAHEARLRRQLLQPLIDANLLIVEELPSVQISDLTDRLQDGPPVDILHYFGHGAWRHGTAHLCLDDGWINASQFAAIAGDVPLMVLYACRSGAVGSDDLFTGIAPMLSAEGVAAVVAMQFTIGVEAALRFSAVFYKNLTQSESLQAAMTKARRALYAEHPMSWYVPVLYIRSRDFKPIMLFKR